MGFYKQILGEKRSCIFHFAILVIPETVLDAIQCYILSSRRGLSKIWTILDYLYAGNVWHYSNISIHLYNGHLIKL